MNLISLLSGVMKVASAVAKYFNRRQLMRAGAAEANAKAQSKVLENVEIARGVTHLVEHGNGDYRQRLRDRFRRPNGG